MYDVVVAVCGGTTPGKIAIDGEIAVRNPFGYMPAETFPFLQVVITQFYMVATGAYICLLAVWSVLLCCHWSSAIRLQKCYIPAVLAVCILEDSMSYLGWNYLNTAGVPSRSLLTCILVLNSVRNTLARILLLVVSMGYGITIPQLARPCCIVALGVLFFVANLGYVIAAQVAHLVPIQIEYLLLATFPVSIVNTAFYMWTFTSLTNTMGKLKQERQDFKLLIFQKLTAVFVTAIGLSLLWFGIECYYRFAHRREEYWQILWRFDAAWHLIFYLTIVGVISLWRPTSKSKDLAFTLQLPDLPDLSKSDMPKSRIMELQNYDIGHEGEST